jgi:hypothetical protein
MSVRRLPVRPDLDQLHRQGKDLLRAIQAGDATATADSCTCNSPTRSGATMPRRCGRSLRGILP